VVQHEELRKINPTSLNTVRVVSFLHKGKVHILNFALRMGVKGSKVDNLYVGGLVVEIKENGELYPFALDYNGNRYYKHPSGYVFEGKKMPAYNKIIDSVKKLHFRLAYFGFIGWDITIDETNEPVFIEYNLMDTFLCAAQLSTGPYFKDITDEILDEVYGKKKRLEKKL